MKIYANYRKYSYLLIPLFMAFGIAKTSPLFEGQVCKTHNGTGVCTRQSKCPILEEMVKAKQIKIDDIANCGYFHAEELICCPTNNIGELLAHTNLKSNDDRYIFDRKKIEEILQDRTFSSNPSLVDRPALKACRQIEKNLGPSLTSLIIGGVTAELGEFPHMAAIGYPNIGNKESPYEFRCGGSLIDKRFVLTAAHCVYGDENQPAIVRLGVTNFSDTEQMRNAVEIKIKKLHKHPDYESGRIYYDIAILELEWDVIYSPNIYPACLYMQPEDPASDADLYVSGFGTVDVESGETSNVLLKAQQNILPFKRCYESYQELGPSRQLRYGISNMQLCTKDVKQTSTTCFGDSGGPLSLLTNENTRQFQIAGIISAGIRCGTTTPSIHTRVSAYLDYIEDIVWPHIK